MLTGVKAAYSTADVARLMKVSQFHVIHLMDRGEIPSWRIPGSKFRRTSHAFLVDYLRDKPEHRFSFNLLELAAKCLAPR